MRRGGAVAARGGNEKGGPQRARLLLKIGLLFVAAGELVFDKLVDHQVAR
jgi:hypothetical protein